MPCEVQGCGYTTAKAEPEVAILLLAHHNRMVHYTKFSCVATACEFVTAKAEPGVAIQLLKSHYWDVHIQKQEVVTKQGCY